MRLRDVTTLFFGKTSRWELKLVAARIIFIAAVTAGLFLQEFVGKVPWAHLDIAGPARAEADDGYLARGGTGFGVRTLIELVQGFRKPR